eukprot:CCRYP_007863-RA/>CCRYP_007863-RA protein AED:0.32 eAED:0.31 QI:0/0/0/1/0/0/3/0/485
MLPHNVPPTPLPQLKDIFIKTYDTHSTLYTDQTRRFLHLSSQGNRYQMILYHVDSNSIWAEPTKNKTEVELILARNRALQSMKACGIHPTRQVLDNEISATYKSAITNSGMSYQLVPPNDHRRNIAEKAIQTWKDHFVAIISGTDNKFPPTFGANYYHRWNANSVFCDKQMRTLTFPPIHISTAIMTTTLNHSYPSAWRPLSTISLTAVKLLLNTAPKAMSLAHHMNTIDAGNTTRISATVFFKDKYITNLSVTPTDAIIAATANLSHLLTNNLTSHHKNNLQLTDLTRLQILTQPPPLPPQREQHTPNTRTTPSSPHLYTPPVVSDYDSDFRASDDESVSAQLPRPQSPPTSPRVTPLQTMPPHPMVSTPPTAPAYNTRSHVQTITQETILHLLHNTQTPPTPLQLQPAILATDTGELLEYHHLIKNPKYSTIWKNAYGKELGRLAQGVFGTVQGTNTIVFIAPGQTPANRQKDITYGQICSNF